MNDSPPFELVSKLEAAERQLRQAIRLFFERKDTISIHTLVSAAYQILFDLAKCHNPSALDRSALNPNNPMIRENKRGLWTRTVRSSQNFFKHADSDPDKTHNFYPGATQFHLYDAVVLYRQLTSRGPVEIIMFQGWFYLKYPDILLDDAIKSTLFKHQIDPNDFEYFLALMDDPDINTEHTYQGMV